MAVVEIWLKFKHKLDITRFLAICKFEKDRINGNLKSGDTDFRRLRRAANLYLAKIHTPPTFNACLHLSNVLTDHFSNSISEKTTKGIPMKFLQCPFKNIFHRLPLSNRGIYIQIIHVRRKAIFTLYGTFIACVNKITFQIGYFT